MQPRRIGPIPLLQGLQLDPPVGKPGGLLDVRNMEGRDGHLATRRGVRLLGNAEPDANYGDVLTYTAVVKSPSVWGSQSLVYLGLTSLTTRPGEWLRLRIGITTPNSTEFDHLKLDYSVGGSSWKPIRFVWSARQHGREIVFLEGSTDNEMYIDFMCPDDWHDQDVGGTTAFWLRIQPRTYSGGSASFSANTEVNTATSDLFFTDLYQRDALWCPFRDGARVVTYGDCLYTNLEARTVFDWSSLSAFNPDGDLNPSAQSLYGSTDQAGRPEVSMLYVPAIDRLLVAFGSHAADCQPAVVKHSTLSGSISVDTDTAWPDSDATDTAWQDVATEGALPDVQDLVLFNERIFVLGANSNKHEIRWSAPSEFATILPSSNLYRLPGGGGGALVGAAVVHRTLYLFTETAIWSVHETDPIEGEDSRMIFNLVEETGCTSKRSITVVNGAVFFLASDGIRVFNGQTSRPITRDVANLFEVSSEHPLAIRTSQMSKSVGVYDPVEQKYYLFYPTPTSRCGNNAALVLDLDTGAAHLWGEDRVGRLDPSEETFAEDGRTPWGFQANAACWDPIERRVFVAQKQGRAGHIDGTLDFGQPIPWSMETHHIGLGDRRFQILSMVDVEVARVHPDWGVNVSIIPDGRLDLKDTRLLGAEQDGLAEPAQFDNWSVGASGSNLAEVSNSYVPVKARYRSRARNHRVVLEGEDIDYGTTPKPIRIASLAVEVLDTGRR